MTVIAIRAGVMAADSRVSTGEFMQPGSVSKLRRMTDGSVCGIVGNITRALAFLEWLNGDGDDDQPRAGDDWGVIQLRPDGGAREWNQGGGMEYLGEFGAWGSGGPCANAAMMAGADALRAVEIAAALQPGCGPPFVFMTPGIGGHAPP